MEKWMVAAKRADFQALGERFGVDPVIARIIRNRGIEGEDGMRRYLGGTLDELHEPSLLKGCDEAVAILQEKIRTRKKIRIIGDYDIDGVNATYILYRGLSRLDAAVDYEIPDRMKDGFGLNRNLIELAHEEKVDTILTCDNGIAAIDQIALAKEYGMTVIVTDHHEPAYEPGETDGEKRWMLPPADAIVNPRQPGCPYPDKEICGAVVAWKVITALYQAEGLTSGEEMEFLEFAAFATVGDVMELQGENRILVRHGLKALRHTKNAGYRALLQLCLPGDAPLSAYHIGFILGPCINASGRLDTAKKALSLLLAGDMEEALPLAQNLKELNDARKEMTARGVEEACRMIDTTSLRNDRVLVVFLPDCHESVAGIIAGRLREKYYRPVFVITRGEVSAKGSGRSIEAYSMYDEMVKIQDVFLKFGGHPMAAGFSLEEERIDEMRRRLNETCDLTGEDLSEKVVIDVPMPIGYITEDLVGQLDLLEPFGKGNEKPLFAQKDLRVLSGRILGKNRNVLKLTVQSPDGCAMEAMYFGDVDAFVTEVSETYGKREADRMLMGMPNQIRLAVVYYPGINEYMGRRTLQIVIKHYRFQ